MNYYQKYVKTVSSSLDELDVTDSLQQPLQRDWLVEIEELTKEVKANGGRFFFAGNGASAAFASHMSLDWSKNGGVPSVPLFDLSHLTALGNDLGYEEVFSTPLGWHGRSSDLLVTISSSGNSPNIIKVIEAAREIGMRVVTLSGLKPDNVSRSMGDLNLYVPAKTYGIVECLHQILLHVWLDHSMGIEEWAREEIQNMRSDEFQL